MITPEHASLIARTREVLDLPPTGELLELGWRFGQLTSLAESLAVELEDALDPDGRGQRLIARLDALNARIEAAGKAAEQAKALGE